jgi:integrase
MRRSDPDFVVGTAPPYKIQPAIVHPRWCLCPRCSALTDDERYKLACRKICCITKDLADREMVVRVQRISPFPSSRPKSAAAAIALKAKLEAELAATMASSPVTPASMPLPEIAELYFSQNPRNVGPETLKRERISAANVIRVLAIVAPDVAADEISEPQAVALRNHRDRVDEAADRTIGGELAWLKMILEFGFRWQSETGMSGVKLLDLPEVGDEQRDGVALTTDEFRAVLEVASPIWRRRLITAATTLIRRTPLLAYQAAWTNLERAWLSVPPAWMKKGRAKKRYPLEVPMSKWAIAQLSGLTPNNGFWWPNIVTGKPTTRVAAVFAAINARVSIVRDGEPIRLRLHDFRDTGISWLRNAGVDEVTVGILSGHRSTFDPGAEQHSMRGANVTRDYTKLYAATLREAVKVQDEIRRQVERPAVRKVG